MTCPLCDGYMAPEHAHFKCVDCGYIAPCCSGEDDC